MSKFNERTATLAVLPAVLEAGRLQMALRQGVPDVQVKADQTPVTSADRQSQNLLIEALRAYAPDIPIVAEENLASANSIGDATRFFLVDPLDGTRDYLKGQPDFTINIALVENGQPVYGLIYAPAIDKLFVTLAPGRAFEGSVPRNADISEALFDQLQPLATRSAKQGRIFAFESREHTTEACQSVMSKLDVVDSRAVGSSLKFCLIARGEGDLYVRMSPTMAWDTAAGQAILEAAGGAVTSFEGAAALRYTSRADGLRNPAFIAWGSPQMIRTP